MKRTKKKGKKWHWHTLQHTDPHERESLNSQQHVLLILLKDGADVLEDVGTEEINAAVYDVAHKRARLFHIMQNLNEQEQPS